MTTDTTLKMVLDLRHWTTSQGVLIEKLTAQVEKLDAGMIPAITKIANLMERVEKLEEAKKPASFQIGDRVRIPFEAKGIGRMYGGYSGVISEVVATDPPHVQVNAVLVEVRDKHAVRLHHEDGIFSIELGDLEHLVKS